MRVLFDQGVPAPLRATLDGHTVETAAELGWSQLSNGDLLARAEAGGFECFLTTDKNLQYQQDLAGRVIAIVVLSTTSWPRIQGKIQVVRDALDSVSAGNFIEVSI